MSTTKCKGWLQASRHIAGLALAAGLVPAAANATTTLSLDPSTQTVAVGGGFDLALNIAGLGSGAGESLSTFDLNVFFDPLLAQFDSFTFGSSLGVLDPSLSGAGIIDPLNPGVLNLYAISDLLGSELDAAQSADFTLGTLHFTALAGGNAGFSIADLILGDSNFPVGTISPDSVEGANVIITGTQPVPEGGPGLMAAVGFGVLVLAQRKLRQHGVSS